jgi:hypothetical protein
MDFLIFFLIFLAKLWTTSLELLTILLQMLAWSEMSLA